MPEGDTIWHAARQLDRALAGRVLTQSDFRVPSYATTGLSGRAVTGTRSRGKHLLTRLGGGRTIHTHLAHGRVLADPVRERLAAPRPPDQAGARQRSLAGGRAPARRRRGPADAQRGPGRRACRADGAAPGSGGPSRAPPAKSGSGSGVRHARDRRSSGFRSSGRGAVSMSAVGPEVHQTARTRADRPGHQAPARAVSRSGKPAYTALREASRRSCDSVHCLSLLAGSRAVRREPLGARANRRRAAPSLSMR